MTGTGLTVGGFDVGSSLRLGRVRVWRGSWFQGEPQYSGCPFDFRAIGECLKHLQKPQSWLDPHFFLGEWFLGFRVWGHPGLRFLIDKMESPRPTL